jgi:hypothetical protein
VRGDITLIISDGTKRSVPLDAAQAGPIKALVWVLFLCTSLAPLLDRRAPKARFTWRDASAPVRRGRFSE